MAQAIDDLIREGREEGISNYQIARNIRDTFPTIITARANLIARTETHNAAGYAADVYYDALRNVTGQIMMRSGYLQQMKGLEKHTVKQEQVNQEILLSCRKS